MVCYGYHHSDQSGDEGAARPAEGKPPGDYEAVLNRLLALVPEGDEEGLYAQAFRVGPLEARLDIKEGRLVDHRDVKRRLGL